MSIQDVDVAQGGLNQRLRRRLGILAQQFLAKGARIDPDTNGNLPVLAGCDNFPNLFLAPDITRVDAQTIDPVLSHLQCDFMIKVNVGHQGHVDLCPNVPKRFRGLHTGYGNPHDVSARFRYRPDLGHGGRHVTGFCVGHALDADGRITAHRHAPDMNLATLATLDG